MLVKLLIIAAALVLGIAASVRAWRVRHAPQPLDASTPGPLPGAPPAPGDAPLP